jgi:WD40 repeat protein
MKNSEFNLNLAVVIGINDYQNGIPPLGTARQDAEAIAHLLKTEYNFQVHLITDTTEIQATSQNLKTWLETELPKVMKTAISSRLLFYFAGHGIALNGDEGPQGYLIPQDAKLGDVATYLPMQLVETALAQLPCRHCLVILDCCFAGAFRWSSSRHLVPINKIIHKERFDRFIQDPAWQVITSAASDQYALDSLDIKGDRGIANNNSQHSPFATALMEALSGAADVYPPATNGKPAGDGIITATELYLYLRDSVEIPTEAKNQRQTPQIWCLKKHDKGEFIFLPPGHQLNLPPAPSLDELEDNNPYRGLESYETKDSALFFGRTTLIDRLYDAIIDRPLTIVLGASGSGKSSLVKAGLIPRLDKSNQIEQPKNQKLKPRTPVNHRNDQEWKILAPIRPGESPLNSLNNALKELGIEESDQVDSKIFTAAIAVWSQAHPDIRLLLVVDQLEELITLCRHEQERQQFLNILADLVQTHSDVLRLVVTLRSDFEPQLRSTALESLWQNARFVVPAMTREELRAVIEEPASAKVVYFESLKHRGYLVEQLIDEVAGMPGALPLLSFALSELCRKLVDRYLAAQTTGDTVERAITWADYDELGGVTKSLTQRATEVYDALAQTDSAYEQTIRHVMLRMVVVGGELARRQLPETELRYPEPENTRVQEVINRFSAARLLVRGSDSDGHAYIEPAHDALVRGWEKLRLWMAAEENLILQRRLTPAAVEWDNIKNQIHDRPQGTLDKVGEFFNCVDRVVSPIENCLSKIPTGLTRLLRRSPNQQVRSKEKSAQFLWNTNPYLDVLDKELKSDTNKFNLVESEFVQESVLKKRRDLSWWWRGSTTAILTLSSIIAFAIYQLRESQKQFISTSIESSTAQKLSQQQIDSIVTAITAGKRVRNGENWNLWELNDIVLAPEQRLRIQVIEALQKIGFEITQSNRWTAHERPLTAVVFSSETCRYKNIVSASEVGEIKIWNQSGKLNQTLSISENKSAIWSLVMSTDCSTLVSGGKDGIVRLWSRDNDQNKFKPQPQEFDVKHKHKGDILAVAVSADGTLVASAGADAKVSLWESNGKWLRDLNDPQNKHREAVRSVGFIPNSNNSQIATAGTDGIKIWKQDGTFLQTLDLQGKDQFVYGIAYSPDGTRSVSAHENGSIKLWEQEGKLWKLKFQPEETHKGVVRAISFSSDGSKIISGGGDRTVKLWNVKKDTKGITRVNLIRTFEGNRDLVRAIAFHPNGSLLASAGADNTIRLWKVDSLLKYQSFLVRDNSTDDNLENVVRDVDFSRDGLFVATASEDQRIRIWQKNTSGFYEQKFITPSTPMIKNNGEAFSVVTFSPNSSLLASGNGIGEIMLWRRDENNISLIKTTEKRHKKKIKSISFNADGSTMVSMSADGAIAVWQRQENGNYQFLQSLQETKVVKIQFVQGGKALAVVHRNGKIKFFEKDSDSGFIEKATTTLEDNKQTVDITEATLSADASLLAFKYQHDPTIRLWQRNKQGNYQFKTVLKGHKGSIDDLAFSFNNKMLSSGGQDTIPRVWDLNSGESINFPEHEKPIFGVAFSSDSKTLASVGWDQQLKLWDVDDLFNLDKSLAKSCAWLQEYLQYGDVADKDKRICSDINLSRDP